MNIEVSDVTPDKGRKLDAEPRHCWVIGGGGAAREEGGQEALQEVVQLRGWQHVNRVEHLLHFL